MTALACWHERPYCRACTACSSPMRTRRGARRTATNARLRAQAACLSPAGMQYGRCRRQRRHQRKGWQGACGGGGPCTPRSGEATPSRPCRSTRSRPHQSPSSRASSRCGLPLLCAQPVLKVSGCLEGRWLCAASFRTHLERALAEGFVIIIYSNGHAPSALPSGMHNRWTWGVHVESAAGCGPCQTSWAGGRHSWTASSWASSW